MFSNTFRNSPESLLTGVKELKNIVAIEDFIPQRFKASLHSIHQRAIFTRTRTCMTWNAAIGKGRHITLCTLLVWSHGVSVMHSSVYNAIILLAINSLWSLHESLQIMALPNQDLSGVQHEFINRYSSKELMDSPGQEETTEYTLSHSDGDNKEKRKELEDKVSNLKQQVLELQSQNECLSQEVQDLKNKIDKLI